MVTVNLYSATITSEDMMTTNITLSGSPNEEKMTLEDLKQESLESPEEDAPISIEVGEMISTTVGGEDALMFDMTVDFMLVVTTTIVIATPIDGAQQFSGMALSMDLAGMMGDLLGGLLGGEETPSAVAEETPAVTTKDLLNAILATVQFQEIPESTYLPAFDLVQCTISKDKNYGLSNENPIVLFQYPCKSRDGEYFAMVTGPKGQAVTYELAGMEAQMEEGETQEAIKYTVTYEGLTQTVIFYIQEIEPATIEEIQQPLVPTGFACKKP